MSNQEDDPLGDLERTLASGAESELAAFGIADAASRALADVIQRAPVPTRATVATADELGHEAIWFMAVIAFRAARAAIWVIRLGYEDQAVAYVRLIDELHNRAQKVRSDSSGSYAREWLEGRSIGKGAKLAGQEFWEMLSGPVHANVRAVLDWLAISQDDGSTKIVLGPERRPEVANGTLVFIAGELRDIAAMLSGAAGLPPDRLRAITAAIQSAQGEHWGPEDAD